MAPTTLYRLFASKDDLVAAYVEHADQGYREWADRGDRAFGSAARGIGSSPCSTPWPSRPGPRSAAAARS